MKKVLTALAFVALTTVSAMAQDSVVFRFGCVSYDEILPLMPEYTKAEEDLATLRAQYDEEMKASEEEFNTKYETFLSEYESYAPSILRKRQTELEDMMHRNEQFRLEALRLLAQAREEMMAPVRAKLDEVVADIASEYQLAFVLNTDSQAVPFINKSMAYNITKAVKEVVVK